MVMEWKKTILERFRKTEGNQKPYTTNWKNLLISRKEINTGIIGRCRELTYSQRTALG
jgi:hypothetical protein